MFRRTLCLSFDPAGLAPLRTYLEQFWTRSLADFKEAVERPATPEEKP